MLASTSHFGIFAAHSPHPFCPDRHADRSVSPSPGCPHSFTRPAACRPCRDSTSPECRPSGQVKKRGVQRTLGLARGHHEEQARVFVSVRPAPAAPGCRARPPREC
jgi:hypothetical protein